MSPYIRILDKQDLATSYGEREQFALDVLVGLSDTKKNISSKYLYDDAGSRLFDEITELEEYYPTRCEIENLEQNRETIAQYVAGEPFNLVEFGPGNGSKTSILIDHMLEHDFDFDYVPIDISQGALESLVADLKHRFPGLTLNALVSDYFNGIKWLNNRGRRKNLVLFLGSNIGNFPHARARFFLRNLWNCLNNGDFVMTGFDLKKDIDILVKAYNDSKGITAQFNLNVLRRINRELGGQFDDSKFRHYGIYDVFTGAMESYLVSLEQQDVFVEGIGRSFSFRPWEPIHIEYSYKYLESDIDMIARETGFLVREHMYDSRRYFVDSLWEVKKAENGHS